MNKPSVYAVNLAATMWQKPTTSGIKLDARLAEEFTKAIDDLLDLPQIRQNCLDYAVKSAEVNYDNEGRPTGSDTDKILKAADKYFNFITKG